MSKREIIQCDTCQKEHDAQSILPTEWVTFRRNDSHGDFNEIHFCSEQCSFDWIVSHWPVVGKPAQEPLECKARRFLLVDGETADITEGVKWQDGSVTLDGGEPSYASWNELKATREGSGVQWIDQEVAG